MSTTPRNNGRPLDSFNDQLRASPAWQNFMRRNGFDVVGRPGLVPRLSDGQRKALKRELEASGMKFQSGMEIDPSGNINQDQGVSAAWNNPWIRYPVLGGAALTGLGAAGIGPMSGLFGGGGAAAGGAAAGGVLPSGSIAGLHAAVPAAIGSQGVSAGVGGALGGLAGAGAAGAAGAGLGNKLLSNLTTPGGIASLASIIPALLASNGGGSEDPMDNEFVRKAYEDARRNNAMAETRYRRTDPLHEAVSQLAYSRLPVSARNGPLPRVTLPE